MNMNRETIKLSDKNLNAQMQNVRHSVTRDIGHFFLTHRILFCTIDDLFLSPRAEKFLRVRGIVYLGDLIQQKEACLLEACLLKEPELTQITLHEIKSTLAKFGLKFDTYVPGWNTIKAITLE